MSDAAADALARVYALLRAGDHAGVLVAAAMLPLPLPPAQLGRVEAWRAQALRALGRVEEADRAVLEAIRAAKADGDAEAVRQLRELQSSIVASLAAKRHADAARAADARLAVLEDDVLLADCGDEAARADALLRRANARSDAGRVEDAASDLARASALAERAGEVRPRVLVLLAQARLTRVTGDEAGAAVHILAAHALADASDDMNLVTAVAQAARAAGVRLGRPTFG